MSDNTTNRTHSHRNRWLVTCGDTQVIVDDAPTAEAARALGIVAVRETDTLWWKHGQLTVEPMPVAAEVVS